MKKNFNSNYIKIISAILILTCSMLFNQRAIGQSQDDWDEVESASNTAAILGALAGVCIAATVVLLIVGNSSDDDKKPKKEKNTKKTGNEKDSTSIIKSDTTSTKKKEEGK